MAIVTDESVEVKLGAARKDISKIDFSELNKKRRCIEYG